jgi:hypothetical protein
MTGAFLYHTLRTVQKDSAGEIIGRNHRSGGKIRRKSDCIIVSGVSLSSAQKEGATHEKQHRCFHLFSCPSYKFYWADIATRS